MAAPKTNTIVPSRSHSAALEIASPEFIQGRQAVPCTATKFAVAIPQALLANASSSTGSVLTTLPGKATVSAISGIGWGTFGVLHKVMQATRFILLGGKTERTLNRAADAIEEIGQRELLNKELYRNAALGTISQGASHIPLAGPAIQGSVAVIGGADALSKQAQRVSLVAFKGIALAIFGMIKHIFSGAWFSWSEKKVSQIKNSCYNNMLHPTPLGEELLLWGNTHYSSALKLVSPSVKHRPHAPACSAQDFDTFVSSSPETKKLFLEIIIASTEWNLSIEEASAFRTVLNRWIMNEKNQAPQSAEDKQVVLNLYAIYKTISSKKSITISHKTTEEEFSSFFNNPLETILNNLFAVTLLHNDSSKIPRYVSCLQKMSINDPLEPCEQELLSQLIGYFVQEHVDPNSYITPRDFNAFSKLVQYRLLKRVQKRAFLSEHDRKILTEKASSYTSWKTASTVDSILVSHIALFYFNQFSKEQRKCMYDLSFEDVNKLPDEHRLNFILEILQKIPDPTLFEKLYIDLDIAEISQRKQEDIFIKGAFLDLESVNSPAKLKQLIKIANNRLSFDDKFLLREALDAPLTIYFFSEEELLSFIDEYTINAYDETVPLEKRTASRYILKILKQAYNWQKAESVDKQAEGTPSSLVPHQGESLPPISAQLPESPLQLIDRKIGSHRVSSGIFYKSFDSLGLVLEKTLSCTGWTVGQVPHLIGYTLDTTVGSTTVYGSIRILAIALQICAQFQTLMNYLAQSLHVTVAGKELNWIEHVERPAAQIPLIPFKLTVPLQTTILGGVESIKSRFDSWASTINQLESAHQQQTQGQSSSAIQNEIVEKESQAHSSFQSVQEKIQTSTDPHIAPMASLSQDKLKEILSPENPQKNAVLQLRNAAIDILPTPDACVPKGFLGFLRMSRSSCEKALQERESSIEASIEHSPLAGASQTFTETTAQLATLYQDLQIAKAAEEKIRSATSFQEIFRNYGGNSLSSVYTNSVSPSLNSALSLWKSEIFYATKTVNAISRIEDMQTNIEFQTFYGTEKVGSKTQEGTEYATKWLAEHIGDYLLAQNSESQKSAAREQLDSVLSKVTGIGARSAMTFFLTGFFGYYTPIIVLPFLLSKVLANLVNASAEPISRNLGKSFLLAYRGSAWLGAASGRVAHRGMEATGRFIQAAINKRMGYIDNERIKAFLSLSLPDQKYIFELVNGSTQIPEKVKEELKTIHQLYFTKSLDADKTKAFIEALLIAYNHLQPQDFLKITPSYFFNLDKRIQKRIKRAVRKYYPQTPLKSIDEIITKFNEMPASARKSINRLTIEEFVALPSEKQRDFCFQVLHSSVYKSFIIEKTGIEPTSFSVWPYIDPSRQTIDGNLLNTLLDLYQDVTEADLSEISPLSLSKAPISRLMRMYEIFATSHIEILRSVAYRFDLNDEDPLPAILAAENPKLPQLAEMRERIIAALVSEFRCLPEYSRRKLFDTSLFELEHMTKEEKKLGIEFLLQHFPSNKEDLTPLLVDAELTGSAQKSLFCTFFNQLPIENKIMFQQMLLNNNQTLSYLTRSLIEEISSIDTQLKRVSSERQEAEEKIAEISSLLNALKNTNNLDGEHDRIEALSNEARKASIFKTSREQTLSTLLEERAAFEKLLNEEHVVVPKCPVTKEEKPDPLYEAMCDLLFSSLTKEMFDSQTDEQLEAVYSRSHTDLSAMIKKLKAEESLLDQKTKAFLSVLSLQQHKLDSAYIEHKKKLCNIKHNLPPHLEIIVRTTKERFSNITSQEGLHQSYSESITLLKELSSFTSTIDNDIAVREIENLFEQRKQELSSTPSPWSKAKTKLTALHLFKNPVIS